jgi:predicted nucleotide-binding protein
MARRPNPAPEPPVLSVEQKRLRIERLQRCIRELEAFDPTKVQKRYNLSEVTALETAIDGALSAAFGHHTPTYNRFMSAATLDNGPHGMRIAPMFDGYSNLGALDAQEAPEARKYLAEGKSQALVLLQEAIRTLNDEIAEQEHLASAVGSAVADHKKGSTSRKVFVVHGHDEGAREAVARFLERIGFEAIILNEQANRGRTVIEKVVAHGDVGFAVVLLTPDDEGGKKGEAARPRPRQNVLLELGYFVGRLGRERVCTLTRGDIELPSDFGGVVYEPFDTGGGWRQSLARELQAAGFDIDWNKVMRP